MNIPGYAYSGTAPYAARYREIEDTPGVLVTFNSVPGKIEFSGVLATDEAMALSETDIAIISGCGALAFGAECVKSGNKFSGHINID